MIRIAKDERSGSFVLEGVDYNPLGEYTASRAGNLISIFSIDLNEYLVRHVVFTFFVDENNDPYPDAQTLVDSLNNEILPTEGLLYESDIAEISGETKNYIAAENISSYDVVYLDTGDQVRKFQPSDTSLYGKVIGLAKTAALAGETVTVQLEGVMDITSSLTPGTLYFADANGKITSTARTTPGLSQIVGYTSVANKFFISIRIPIEIV